MKKFLLNLFFISFLLNFVWEISQMGFYSTLGMGDVSDYWNFIRIHWAVSLKDALMVVVVYLAIGFILKNWHWSLRWNSGWLMLWLALPVWQGIIEYYSVYVFHRWAYAPVMPLLSGVGIVPMMQMLLLPSLAVWWSRSLRDR